MEPKKLSINQYAMQYGLLLGIVMIIFDLVMYIFKAPMGSPLQYLNLVIIIAFIVYGSINYRNKHSNGYINYGKSLLTCFLIALYGGIVFAIYKYFFLKFFDHSMILKLKDFARQKIAEKGAFDDDKIDQIMEVQKWVYTPFVLTVSGIINSAFWGLLFSLIISIFVKKEDNSFETATNTDQL